MSSEEMLKLFQRYVIPNYGRFPVALGARRRIVRLGRRGQPLSRPVLRLGLQSAGALPAAGGRGGPRTIGRVDPRAQHVAHRTPRALGQGAFGAEFRRPGVLLQFRHRGQRGGHQARPAAQRRPTSLQDHYVRGRFPRPHAGLDLGHRSAEVSRGPRAADGRLRLRPVRRSRRRRAADRRRNRGDPDRADPRRRRRPHSARRFPGRPAPTWPTSTSCC